MFRPPRLRRIRTLRIRTQLLLTTGAILLPVILAGGVAIDWIVRHEREAALRGLAETARATALLVDREALAAVARLQALARSEHLARGDLRGFHDNATALLERQDRQDRWIVLLDPSGRPLAHTARVDGAAPAQPHPEAAQQASRVLAAGQPRVSGALRDPVTGQMVALVQVPVPRVQDRPAVLAEAIAAEHWQRTALRTRLPDGWIALIADRDGRLVSRSREAQALAGQPLVPTMAAAAASRGNGVVRSLDRDGTPIYMSFAGAEATGWTVGVGAPIAQLDAPPRRALWLALGGLLLTLALAPVALAMVGRQLARDVSEAGAAARALGHGRRPQVRPLRLQEFSRLMTDIDVAAELLQHEQRSRTAVEDAMEQLELRLAGVLHTATDAIIITDANQAVVLYNDAAEAMFGLPGELVLGENVRWLLPPDCWAHFVAQSHAEAAHGAPLPGTLADRALVTARRASGAEFRMECSISQLSEPDGATFYTIVARDVTQRVREQEALVRAHEDLRQATQRYQRALMTEVEAGHARISQELHDSVGSSLAGIMLLLRVAHDRAANPPIQALLRKASEQLKISAEALRKISHGIMPVGGEAGGLPKALEQYAQDLSSYKEIDCAVRTRGSFECLHPNAGTHLYRIVQEATSNAIRHGGATRLRIRLAQAGDRCRLTVRDNGSGCPPDALDGARAGMGLRSMQVRAQAVGGRLEVANVAAGGCRVRLSWPCARPGPLPDGDAPPDRDA